jgi:prolyl oligopeptidase
VDIQDPESIIILGVPEMSNYFIKGSLQSFVVYLRKGVHLNALYPIFSILGVLLFFTPAEPFQNLHKQNPPETRRDNVREVIHGVEIFDHYRWLEDQKSPETRNWVRAQNEYTQSILRELPERDELKERVTELLKIDRIGMPVVRDGQYFFSKRTAEQELSVIYTRKGISGKDEILLDPHTLSSDQTKSVHLLDVSKDGSLIVYGIREGGEDEIIVHLFDVKKRENLEDQWTRGRYFGFSLKPDKKGLYYSRHSEKGSGIYYHDMGIDPSKDVKIFGDGYGLDTGISSGLSEDGRYLQISVWHGSAGKKTEIYVKDVEKNGPIVPIVNDIDARFSGKIAEDQLFMKTNWKAPNGRIIVVDLKKPDRKNWREVIPETDAVLRGFSLAGNKIFVNYLKDVQSHVKVFTPDGKHIRDLDLPTIGSVSGVRGKWENREAFFRFSSYHIPYTIYRYDVEKDRREVWSRLDFPIDTDKFETKQVWYTSKDGTRVPMFLIHGKEIQLNGLNPTILTGYGGFNSSLTPGFSSRAALWIEKGGIYAIPNLRGGGEFGEEWHRAGMRDNKQNVFDDFISAAEWLIQKGYTKSEKLAIRGGSNGGLLVGAVLTQRPDLYQAVVCGYPLLDMIRYHKFLVAPFWISEYGSSDDPDQFKYIHAYSPYHRVKEETHYPAVLMISGDSDTRVDPLHARKMAALLQSSNGSDNPVLLRYETKLGHSGGRPDELSFLIWQLDVK